MNDGSDLQVLEREIYRDMALEITECTNGSLLVTNILYWVYSTQRRQRYSTFFVRIMITILHF